MLHLLEFIIAPIIMTSCFSMIFPLLSLEFFVTGIYWVTCHLVEVMEEIAHIFNRVFQQKNPVIKIVKMAGGRAAAKRVPSLYG